MWLAVLCNILQQQVQHGLLCCTTADAATVADRVLLWIAWVVRQHGLSSCLGSQPKEVQLCRRLQRGSHLKQRQASTGAHAILDSKGHALAAAWNCSAAQHHGNAQCKLGNAVNALT